MTLRVQDFMEEVTTDGVEGAREREQSEVEPDDGTALLCSQDQT